MTKQRESAILIASDAHFGKRTATFSPDIAHERLIAVGQRLGRIRELLSDYAFDELVICLLGDVVDGASIYPTQFHHQELTNADEQADALSGILADLAREQRKVWGKVRFECVPGNHGSSGKFAHESQNYDLTTYKYLDLRLADKRIPVNVNQTSDPFVRAVDVRGHRYLCYHGHAIRSFANIPWYGMMLRASRWLSTRFAPFDCVCMGHFHTFGTWTINQMQLFLTGTLVSDDDWSLQTLGYESASKWWLIGASDSRPVTWSFGVELK